MKNKLYLKCWIQELKEIKKTDSTIDYQTFRKRADAEAQKKQMRFYEK